MLAEPLDKIVGDELMVLYGVPLKNEMDTENAVNTAVVKCLKNLIISIKK